MNRARFSTIAHGDHIFYNPLNTEKVNRVLDLLLLSAGDRVLDVGCGNAELLIRLVERYDVVGVGVDPSADALDQARRRAVDRISLDRLQLHQKKMSEAAVEEGTFDAALCVGATHAFGDYRATLAALQRLVKPGGQILVGEGYWKRAPDAGYLALLDAAPGELMSHSENVAAGGDLGLTPLYTTVSSDDDWDHYEGLYCRAIERWAATHPDDPEREEFVAYIRTWYAGYLRWGRDTLGFGLYLFRA